MWFSSRTAHTCCWCSLDLGEAWGSRPSKYDTSFVVSQGRAWIKLVDEQSTHLIQPAHPLRHTVSLPQSVCVNPPSRRFLAVYKLPTDNWFISINNTASAQHLFTQINNSLSHPTRPTSEFVYWINSSLLFWHTRSRSNSNKYCTPHTSSPHQHSLPRPLIKMCAWRLIVLRARAFLWLNGTTVDEWIMGDWVSNKSSSHNKQGDFDRFQPGSPNTLNW
jgi:hypothetical protein